MVHTAARLLRQQGYAATGWRQVIAESDTPWGSQSHHFPGGKEELAVEAVRQAGEFFEQGVRRAFEAAHPADAIRGWGDLAAKELEASDWMDGCPVATVTLEMAHTSDAIATACHQAFASWSSAISDGLRQHGADPATSKALATCILAGIEGALILARAERSGEPLRTVASELSHLVRSRLGSS